MVQKPYTGIKPFVHLLILFISTLSFMLALPGCSQKSQWEKEYTDLLNRTVDLKHRHCQLNASIDSLWDTTSIRLLRALPASFPATDRDIFFKARNADHIRMFMSFKLLDSTTQLLVNNAGKYDAALAAQMHALREQSQAFEQSKIQFLKQVEQQNTEVSRNFAALFTKAATETCQ